MILNVIILVVLLAIAYFHYAQGLFSATVSAACAGIAALMAFAFHESLARVGGGAMGSFGDAVSLVGLFAIIYLVLRFIIDNFMVGNVRYPVALDKIGAAVMGLIAGIFTTGIIALTAQQLPFGPDIAMYERFSNEDLEIAARVRLSRVYNIDSRDSGGDLLTYSDVVTAPVLGANDETGGANDLWVPTDSWLVSLVNKLSSADGSLSGNSPISSVYPEGADGYKNALFARRIGLQRSASQVAMNTSESQQVSLAAPGGLFLIGTEEGQQYEGGILQIDGEDRGRDSLAIDKLRRPAQGKSLVVIRTLFDKDAADKRSYIRFGLGNARLVAGGKQYFPVGTLESSRLFAAGRPDDFVLTEGGADLVFEVDTATALAPNGSAMAADAFLEFKELARVPLGGDRIFAFVTQDARSHVLRKELLKEWISSRLLDTDIADPTATTAFAELRNTMPEVPADPEAAEMRFLGGGDPNDPTTSPTTSPSTSPAPGDDATNEGEPGEQDGGALGIGDALRDRNRQLQGDGN